MNRQVSFTEKDIEPVIHNRRLLRYDIACGNRNAKNFKAWQEKWIAQPKWLTSTYSTPYTLLFDGAFFAKNDTNSEFLR